MQNALSRCILSVMDSLCRELFFFNVHMLPSGIVHFAIKPKYCEIKVFPLNSLVLLPQFGILMF